MDFNSALRALLEGKAVRNSNITNGEKEELVMQDDCAFIKTPRTAGTVATNFIFSVPTVTEMLSDIWEVEE